MVSHAVGGGRGTYGIANLDQTYKIRHIQYTQYADILRYLAQRGPIPAQLIPTVRTDNPLLK
jgi:hypothetical protein